MVSTQCILSTCVFSCKLFLELAWHLSETNRHLYSSINKEHLRWPCIIRWYPLDFRLGFFTVFNSCSQVSVRRFFFNACSHSGNTITASVAHQRLRTFVTTRKIYVGLKKRQGETSGLNANSSFRLFCLKLKLKLKISFISIVILSFQLIFANSVAF